MNNKELKILYKFVQDLFFDIDRMAQSGKDTLGKIDNIIQEKLYHVRRDKCVMNTTTESKKIFLMKYLR